MEYEELQALWGAYDKKLDKLEKLNRKLLVETLARKPQKRINRWLFRSIYGMLVGPVVIGVVLSPFIRDGNLDVWFFLGCLLILFVVVSLVVTYYKGYLSLRKVDLLNDPVIDSVKKINVFRSILFENLNYQYFLSGILFLGLLVIIWDDIYFDTKTISFLVVLVFVLIVWTKRKVKMNLNSLEKLKTEILELEEYE